MRNIAIIDDSFDSSLISSYHLSIQYCDQFCSMVILDAARMKYIAFKNFWFANPVPAKNQADHIHSLLHGESYLTRQFKSAFFMYVTPISVLVPAHLFRKENLEIYFKLSSRILPNDRVIYRRIPAIDAYILFLIQEQIINEVSILVPDVQIFHQSCSQITEAMAESSRLAYGTRVLANINAGFVDLTVIQSDQVILYNSFAIKTTNDLVFFILYMYEQFGLSQDDCPVVLSGFAEMYTGTIEFLHHYVKKVVMREFQNSYTYSPTFGCLAQHQYAQLISLAGCE